MSLFGTSPPEADSPSLAPSTLRGSRSLFDDDAGPAQSAASSTLFADDDDGGSAGAGAGGSPWDMPTPRKQQSRAELVRNLLAGADVPDSYLDTFDAVVRADGSGGRLRAGGIAKVFAAARLAADQQARVMSIVVPPGADISVGRGEFNVLLALIGLAQEGEVISLDGVDERRRNLPRPKLQGLTAEPVMPPVAELGAKPPQATATPTKAVPPAPSSAAPTPIRQSAMSYPDAEADPWASPDVHKGHNHAEPARTNGTSTAHQPSSIPPSFRPSTPPAPASQPSYVSSTLGSDAASARWSGGAASTSPRAGPGLGYFDGNTSAGSFNNQAANPIAGAFGGGGGDDPGGNAPLPAVPRLSSGRTGSSLEENILVTLMPEKEGVFMFQHHNYEVTSARRGSKVVRRYSDFVWLLDCLHKRYPFRVLPLLPPKRVAVNGNHLSNDGAFIEKRRRGLARFLNAVIRHPLLSQEKLVVMFLTVPTELSVWRKQAAISVQDEFTDRPLPPGLEDSLPVTLNELFDRTRSGVRRSADLYINVCNVMDRLVKRSEGVAADHARIAMSLTSLTEASADAYATDTNDVPLLNDGLVAMSKHLRTAQGLMEDESRAWEQGVLEDLKRQRDALVSVREMFERRERLDKDNIPYLERRIQSNETKLAGLRAKPDGLVKPGEIEKVVEAIIKDKESIVNQHNRSVFVKECIRDELIYFQSTQYHVSRWNQDWAQERVKYAEMLADNWRRLLDELEGMPLGD